MNISRKDWSVELDDALWNYRTAYKGYEVNLGRICEESILDYAKGNFTGNIPYPSLITLLCIKEGVKFNE